MEENAIAATLSARDLSLQPRGTAVSFALGTATNTVVPEIA